jgi:hypothetical protein
VGAFNAISEAQKIEFQSRRLLLTAELFPWLAIPGLTCLTAAALLARPWWRREALVWA